MESTWEVLTTRQSGREIHRHWPDEVTAQIVSENLRPGVMVNELAERHGLKPNHLSTWRTMSICPQSGRFPVVRWTNAETTPTRLHRIARRCCREVAVFFASVFY
ncbi:transposase [Rhizobium leguminosarum bv. viciae]|nr:transposase [Rhizobium leguminosarum bv. viciae]